MKTTVQSMLTLGAMLAATQAGASVQPLHVSSDARIEVVAYSPYNVVPIQGTPFTTTQITFGKGEYIENVQNGDLGAWTASINKDLPNMMFVKPTTDGSDTNMTVVTNQHTYYFQLASPLKGQARVNQATYALHFIYPEQQRKKVEQQIIAHAQQQQAEISAFSNPTAYHWDYSFHGDTAIMPLHVFDDGKFTYLQLQRNQPIPAVFAVTSPSGQESVVNYRQDGDYLVLQRVAPQWTLRLGKAHVASIFNNPLIATQQSNSDTP